MRAALLVMLGVAACDFVYPLEFLGINAPHLQPEAQVIGTNDIVIEDGAVIDTTGLTGPNGLVLDSAVHVDQTFDLAVLRSQRITFLGTVTVTGGDRSSCSRAQSRSKGC